MKSRAGNDPLTHIVGLRIMTFRHRREFSVRGFARASGVSAQLLGQIEKGINSPNVRTLSKIAKTLGVTPADLLNVDCIEEDCPGTIYEALRDNRDLVHRMLLRLRLTKDVSGNARLTCVVS